MAGMIGMAQTLGVYHYGYFTLKGRDIQYHGPSKCPSDKVPLDWGLVDPFISQDKPPLAIAMIVTPMARECGDDIGWLWHAEISYGYPLMSLQH